MPGWLTLFGTVFAVVFLVELPDKTALTTVVLATRYRPLPVFAGVALAFVIQSVVAVFAGSLIAFLPRQAVQIGAGLLFIVLAGVVVWRARRQAAAEKKGQLPSEDRGRRADGHHRHHPDQRPVGLARPRPNLTDRLVPG